MFLSPYWPSWEPSRPVIHYEQVGEQMPRRRKYLPRRKKEHPDERTERRSGDHECPDPGRIAVVDRDNRGLSAGPVDHDIDAAPGPALCPAYTAPLWAAPGRGYLVDVVPAHPGCRPADHLRAELDLFRPQHCRERRAAHHRATGCVVPIAGPSGQALAAGG